MQKSQSYRRAKEHEELYDGLVKSYKLDKDLFESYGKAYSLKRGREDKDKDEDPPARSDQGLKRQKTSKDGEQLNVKDAPKHDCKITQAEKPPLSFDELMSTPIDFSAYVMNHLKIDHTQNYLVGLAFNLLKGTCRSRVELESNIEECRQVVPVDYFINNDLEYLKGGSSTKKYTTLTTKTKVANGHSGPTSPTEPRYTTYNNPQGIIYEDKYKRNRMMRTDELYKFSDGTLTSVRYVLHDIASNLRID
ncbi:hypothetical protein Tco_0276042 [Tanacetum coccineum]